MLLYFKKRKRAVVHDKGEIKWMELQEKVCRFENFMFSLLKILMIGS